MFHMQAYAAEKEQKNCSYPMYKLAKDLKMNRWTAFYFLYNMSVLY